MTVLKNLQSECHMAPNQLCIVTVSLSPRTRPEFWDVLTMRIYPNPGRGGADPIRPDVARFRFFPLSAHLLGDHHGLLLQLFFQTGHLCQTNGKKHRDAFRFCPEL